MTEYEKPRILSVTAQHVAELERENAKLRELVRDMWHDGMCECDERVLRSGHQWGLDAPAATAEFVERCRRLAGDE